VHPLGIPHTRPSIKFEVFSLSSFGAIDAAMVDVTLDDLNKGQGLAPLPSFCHCAFLWLLATLWTATELIAAWHQSITNQLCPATDSHLLKSKQQSYYITISFLRSLVQIS